MNAIKVVKHWDAMPVVVMAEGEMFSTRVLERKYRMMEDALNAMVNNGLDARQCHELAASTLAEVRE